MKLREILPTLLLGLLGIVAAAAIAMAANEVSGGQIALSADPVFGVDDERLVEPGERRKGKENASGSGDAPTAFDDNGETSGSGDPTDADGGGNGSDDNSGSGSGSSGSGGGELEFEGREDSNSGSGSSGSGSSGSGSSGSGSSGSGSGDSSEHGGDDD